VREPRASGLGARVALPAVMRHPTLRHPSSVLLLALACALASCLQGPMSNVETDPGEAQPSTGAEPIDEARQETGSNGSEPIGEAQQEGVTVGRPYESADFPFVVQVTDDHRGKAGGWQVCHRHLLFTEERDGYLIYAWSCKVDIGMPIRSVKEKRISPFLAALYSAEVANAVANPLLDSREN
jgi:hypothetical protein